MRRSTKSVRIERELRKVIAGVGPGTKLPTVRELMAKFRASQSAVVGAINRLEQQHLLVRKAGSGLYAAEHASTGRILILLDGDVALSPSPFYTMLLDALFDVHQATEETVEVCIVPPTVSRKDVPVSSALPDQIMSRLRAGLDPVCIAVNVRESLIGALREAGCPTVGFACLADCIVHLGIDANCTLAVEGLVRMGCRSAAFLGQTTPEEVTRYRSLCNRAGIEVVRAQPASGGFHTRVQEIRSGERVAFAYKEAAELVRHGVPEGVAVLDDVHALGAFMAFEERGVRVGTDVRAVTWWNVGSPLLLGWQSRVARLELDVQQVAETLREAAAALAGGALPITGPWEHAVEVVGPTQTSLITSVPPTLRLNCSDTQ